MWRAGIAAVFMIAAFAAAAQSSGGSTRPFAAISSDTLVERYQDLAESMPDTRDVEN